MAEMVWVYDSKKKDYVQVPAPSGGSGKGVTVRPIGSATTPTMRAIGSATTPAIRPLGSAFTPQPSIGMSSTAVLPKGVLGRGQQANVARDGLGNPIQPKGPTPGILQGPGEFGPIGSAQQAYGMLQKKYGLQSGPGETELDSYGPLGNLGSLLKSLLSAGGGSGGGGSDDGKQTISRAALRKALTSAKNEISQAYNTAGTGISSAFATNPYAGLQAQESTVDPGLNALFESQGVSPNALGQMVSANREAATQRQAGMGDLYKLLEANYAQNAAAQQAGIQAQRASSLDDLMQQYAAILGSGKVY